MNARGFLDNYSLEITASDVGRLGLVRSVLPPNSAVSITFLPRDDVDELAKVAVAVRQLGFMPVPHISARRIKSRDHLVSYLQKLRDFADVDRVFVIAGDPPFPLGPYDDALAIIRTELLAEFGVRYVGIAGYPEGHPHISREKLLRAMKDKLAALAKAGQNAEIVTQFAFDADVVLAWLARIRAEGVNTTIRIGLPGPTSVQSLLHFAARCGVGVSGKVLAKYGVSITRLLNTATPDMLARKLSHFLDPNVHGMVKAHLYPFGGITKTVEWAETFSPVAVPHY